MSFVPKKHTYNAHINEVVLGVGDKAVTIGGQNVLAFHTFDGEITNAPKIGVELTDAGMAMCTMPGEQKFYEGCATVADMAKRASAMEGASFICLHLEGADPNGENKSVDECVELAKSVADATDMPLVVMGCKNIEKDTELFNKIAEALTGKNILVLSARDENYKAIGAGAGLAYGQKVGAESAVDINLSDSVYSSTSVAAAAVAAHECGHAVQHAQGYAPLTLRSQLVPVVQFSSTAATWVIILGLVLMTTTQNALLCWIGVGMIAMSAIFSLVTLPVEYNASARALEWLQVSRTMQGAQLAQAKEALGWAARTYLVAALSAVASVLYWVFVILGRRD